MSFFRDLVCRCSGRFTQLRHLPAMSEAVSRNNTAVINKKEMRAAIAKTIAHEQAKVTNPEQKAAIAQVIPFMFELGEENWRKMQERAKNSGNTSNSGNSNTTGK